MTREGCPHCGSAEITAALACTACKRAITGTAAGRDLRGAPLAGMDLRDVDFTGANLGGAILTKADLRGANLNDVDVRGADLDGARIDARYSQYLSGIRLKGYSGQ